MGVHDEPESVFSLGQKMQLSTFPWNRCPVWSGIRTPKAITATAHKLARIFYSMIKHGEEYVDRGQEYYEEQYRERAVKSLKKRAQLMGFVLVAESIDSDAVLSTG